MPYVIGLDYGTSAVKGVLIDAAGMLHARATGAAPVTEIPDGRIEIDPAAALHAFNAVIAQLCAQCPAGGDIAAVSAAFASGNMLLLDEKQILPVQPSAGWIRGRLERNRSWCPVSTQPRFTESWGGRGRACFRWRTLRGFSAMNPTATQRRVRTPCSAAI